MLNYHFILPSFKYLFFLDTPSKSNYTMLTRSVLSSLALAGIGSAQSLPHIQTGGLVQNTSRYETRLRVDNGTYGPEIEEVHYCKATSRSVFPCKTLTTTQITTSGLLVSPLHLTDESLQHTHAATTTTHLELLSMKRQKSHTLTERSICHQTS